jgi:predicted hydrocarbon binding protein
MLSHRCAELGSDGIRALREAGYRAGLEVLATLGDEAERMTPPEFWHALREALEEASLGSVVFEPVSPAIGGVAWRGSIEAGGTRSQSAGIRCHFAAGLLGGVLSRTAGKTVDVLEVRCGGDRSETCWFLFGTVANIRTVYESRFRDRSDAPVSGAPVGERHPVPES